MAFNSSTAPRRLSLGQAPAQEAPAAAEALPEAQFWLNVGSYIDVTNPDGTIEKQFVPLPRGLALDTMPQEAVRGGDAFRKLMAHKNQLLEQLVSTLEAHVEPGEEVEIPLVCIVRRVKPAGVVVEDHAPVFDFGFGAATPAPKKGGRK